MRALRKSDVLPDIFCPAMRNYEKLLSSADYLLTSASERERARERTREREREREILPKNCIIVCILTARCNLSGLQFGNIAKLQMSALPNGFCYRQRASISKIATANDCEKVHWESMIVTRLFLNMNKRDPFV